jgi:hypothetical protein
MSQRSDIPEYRNQSYRQNYNSNSRSYYPQTRYSKDSRPFQRQKTEGEFDYPTFKIYDCQKMSCPNYDKCNGYHQQDDKRRDPFIYYYTHVRCTIQECKNDFCNYSHNEKEELYHPTMFKTRECSLSPCLLERFCPYLHAKEIAEIEQKMLEVESENLKGTLDLLDVQMKQEEKKIEDLNEFKCSKCSQSVPVGIFLCGHLICEDCSSSNFCEKCKQPSELVVIKE